ncbi:MAG: HigA family addiction module antitoxin [Kiloniellaceae bacterium]
MTGPWGAGDPIHPGEILQTEFLGPHGLSKTRLARATGLSSSRLARLTRGRGRIGGEVAFLLGRAFHTTPEFWLNLQAHYDLERAQATIAPAPVAHARTLGRQLRRAR